MNEFLPPLCASPRCIHHRGTVCFGRNVSAQMERFALCLFRHNHLRGKGPAVPVYPRGGTNKFESATNASIVDTSTLRAPWSSFTTPRTRRGRWSRRRRLKRA